MPSWFTLKTDIRSCLFLLGTVSPLARRYLEQEYYRYIMDDDDVSDVGVLRQLFLCVQSDLQQIGITFSIDFDAVYFDDQMFADFVNLCRVLLPNTLFPILKRDARFTEVLYGITDGSLGGDEPALLTYLRMIAGDIGTPPLIPELRRVIHYLIPVTHTSDLFMDYLQTMRMSLEEQQLVPNIDPKNHEAYLQLITTMLWSWNTLEAHLTMFSDVAQAYAKQLRLYWKRDMQCADHQVQYQYLMLQDPNTLPDGIRERWERGWYHYRVSHPFFLEYYSARKYEVLAEQDLIALAIGCYLYEDDPHKRQDHLQAIATAYPQNDLQQITAFLSSMAPNTPV